MAPILAAAFIECKSAYALFAAVLSRGGGWSGSGAESTVIAMGKNLRQGFFAVDALR
jgi:hypothetical protein